jgi:hypothetical protein
MSEIIIYFSGRTQENAVSLVCTGFPGTSVVSKVQRRSKWLKV